VRALTASREAAACCMGLHQSLHTPCTHAHTVQGNVLCCAGGLLCLLGACLHGHTTVANTHKHVHTPAASVGSSSSSRPLMTSSLAVTSTLRLLPPAMSWPQPCRQPLPSTWMYLKEMGVSSGRLTQPRHTSPSDHCTQHRGMGEAMCVCGWQCGYTTVAGGMCLWCCNLPIMHLSKGQCVVGTTEGDS